MSGFVHLNVASAFSAHHGTSSPEELVEAAKAQGQPAAAITDRDGIYGAVRHVRACMSHGILPVVGANLQVKTTKDTPAQSLSEITVLAHGNNQGAGWASLVRLISAAHAPKRGARRTARGSAHRAAWLSAERPAAFLLAEEGPTATVMLGPDSDVGQAVLAGDAPLARDRLASWQQQLPGAVVLELVSHRTRPGLSASMPHAAQMLQLAQASGVQAVLTNAVRYRTPDEAVTGDVLDAAAHLLPLGEFSPQPNAQAWLKPAETMHQIAAEIAREANIDPQVASRILENTEALAQRCILDPHQDLGWQQPKVPEPVMLDLSTEPDIALRQRCEAAVNTRYPHHSDSAHHTVHQRLADELSTITGFGFSTYFLTVADVTDLIRNMNVRVQARGSGAGSLVNYLLGISSVDPLEHDLLFERFLGHQRSTLPDIDLDVESARRHEIYEKIFARYGDHRVTLLSMQNRYRARGAARDAGLALGLDEQRIDQIAQSLWRFPAQDFRQALRDKPELREVAELVNSEPQLDLLVELTQRLDRLPRHISMHPCGVILGNTDLLSTTPTQPSGIGLPMSQFDKDDIDDMGLLKLDILGVRMQSTMAYALDEISRVNGPAAAEAGGFDPEVDYIDDAGRVDLESVPTDDENTFAMIRTTHTLGCFQIESPGQRELIGKLQPDSFSDLIADISLFRPGPMKGNMVSPFVERKQGFEKISYLHPRFEPFLQDSYGVVIYHEHVLRILAETMGISLADADELRRRMESDADSVEAEFRRRASQTRTSSARSSENQGFSDSEIDRIWRLLHGFGSFGFCKAHGASFALPTYQSAWLKTHYPVEFLCALFEHDPGMYPRRLLMSEARRIGIPLLPVDVNVSTGHYRVEQLNADEKGIRLSLSDIRGITEAEIASLIKARPYTSVTDFHSRSQVSAPLMLRLVSIGALDSLAEGVTASTRGGLIAYVRRLIAINPASRSRQLVPESTQPTLFSEQALFNPEDTSPSQNERISAQLDAYSAELESHVMESYRELLDEIGVTSAEDLPALSNHSEVLVAGIRVATQTPPMRSGKRTVFISLDDGTGCADVTFFEEAQQQAGPLLFGTQLLVIRGSIRRTGEKGLSLQADAAWDLKQMWNEWQRAQHTLSRQVHPEGQDHPDTDEAA